MPKKQTNRYPVMIAGAIVSAVLGSLIVLGQGGTGRAPSNTNAPKKTPARKTPTRRTSNTTQSNEPSSQTDSQPVATPEPTPAASNPPIPTAPAPTLQETLDWLGAKLTTMNFVSAIGVDLSGRWESASDGLDYHNNWSEQWKYKTSYTIETCALHLKMQSPNDWVARVDMSFGDIDPGSIKEVYCGGFWTSGVCLQAESSGAKKPFVASTSNHPHAQFNQTKSGSSIQFVFSNTEARARAEVALKRAVELCGGKRDPF